MASVATAKVVDNVTPAETIKAGWDKYNEHWHEYDAVLLTNRKGSSTAVGDVLAVSTANDSSAILGDTSASLQKFVVAQAIIADAATGEFARSGVVTAKATGSIALGQYVKKSGTTLTVDDAGTAIGATATPPAGTLGVALAAASGGTVLMHLFEQTEPGASAATQAEMETGSSITVFTTPGRQHFHPGHPKATGNWNNAGTIAEGYNLTSITDTNIGDHTVTIATDFSNTTWEAQVTAAAAGVVLNAQSHAAGTVRIIGENTAGAASDATVWQFIATGDQA